MSSITHGEDAAAPVVPAPAVIAEEAILPSVLERFKTYSGERTPDGLRELFTLPVDTKLRQQPQIAISDGRSAVILAINIPDAKDAAPNFTLKGASTLALNRIKANEWQLRVLPQRGVSEVSLIVMKGTTVSEYPLTVVPPLPAETDLTEVGFRIYLAAEGGVDLNRDGRSDFLDDYIYTGNYIARRAIVGTDLKSRRERALRNTLAVKPPPAKEPELVEPPMELPDNSTEK
jgi:hypothetical protein